MSEKSKGLGDSIEKFTKATGIKKVVDIISEATGVDCGCTRRKEQLNKLVSYKAVDPEPSSNEPINVGDSYLLI